MVYFYLQRRKYIVHMYRAQCLNVCGFVSLQSYKKPLLRWQPWTYGCESLPTPVHIPQVNCPICMRLVPPLPLLSLKLPWFHPLNSMHTCSTWTNKKDIDTSDYSCSDTLLLFITFIFFWLLKWHFWKQKLYFSTIFILSVIVGLCERTVARDWG
jgi:hypothetical protein